MNPDIRRLSSIGLRERPPPGVRRVATELRRGLPALVEPHSWTNLSKQAAEHRAILDAVRLGEADLAAERLAAHIAHTTEVLIKLTEAEEHPPGA